VPPLHEVDGSLSREAERRTADDVERQMGADAHAGEASDGNDPQRGGAPSGASR